MAGEGVALTQAQAPFPVATFRPLRRPAKVAKRTAAGVVSFGQRSGWSLRSMTKDEAPREVDLSLAGPDQDEGAADRFAALR